MFVCAMADAQTKASALPSSTQRLSASRTPDILTVH